MNVYEMFGHVTAGGFVAVLVIIMSLVEIAPIKLSPLQWIGKRINKQTLDRVAKIDKKLDEHIAQSYRTKILSFQDDILAGCPKTKEQWFEVTNAITLYTEYCEDNDIKNGLCHQASIFLSAEYQRRLATRDFAKDLVS